MFASPSPSSQENLVLYYIVLYIKLMGLLIFVIFLFSLGMERRSKQAPKRVYDIFKDRDESFFILFFLTPSNAKIVFLVSFLSQYTCLLNIHCSLNLYIIYKQFYGSRIVMDVKFVK